MTFPSQSGRASTLDLIDSFMEVRQWQDANLPIYGSFIGLDLIIFLSRSQVKNTPYSLKDVFHSLRYSEGALRIFIRRLEKDGWIRLETWPGDRRNKKIIVNENLITAIDEFLHLIVNINARSQKLSFPEQ
jgi:hypothetical protein